jgi:signal peptidase II
MSKKQIAFLVIVMALVLDQIMKIWIKTSFVLGEDRRILGNWFLLHFVENNGMAFGFEFAGKYGKVILSLFRIVAVIGIGWYLGKLIKKGIPTGLVISISLIMAGALGNIVDSAFYGLIFSESLGQVAQLFPEEGGYAPFLYGKVVDMLFFPIIKTSWPSWSPINPGESFVFFRPVFNFADSFITIGISIILLFFRRYFNESHDKQIIEEIEEQAS